MREFRWRFISVFHYNPKEKQLVFENTHEAIIDADTWERVQELRKNIRHPTRTGKTNLFSVIVRCADCGEKLYYCTSKNFEAWQDHFVCSTSRLKGKEVCPTHFIRAVVLEQGVLAHMRLVIACVSTHGERFRKAIPFPENIPMLFYEFRPYGGAF